MTISLIVAASANHAIGKNNQLLWRLPADMRFFKNTTWALPVIMGRKTFESLGKPLQGRANFVVTSQAGWQADGTIAVSSLEEGLKQADRLQTNEIMVIGGGQIYAAAMPQANRIYMTRVHTWVDGDTFFPEIPASEWQLVSRHDCFKDEKHAYDFSFEVWERK